MSERDKQFILWKPAEGQPSRDSATGEISTAGVMGRIGIENAYLTTYGSRPEGSKRYDELEVGECVIGVRFSLSGTVGYYDVYRVI